MYVNTVMKISIFIAIAVKNKVDKFSRHESIVFIPLKTSTSDNKSFWANYRSHRTNKMNDTASFEERIAFCPE